MRAKYPEERIENVIGAAVKDAGNDFMQPRRLTGGANGGIIESGIYHAGLSGNLQKLKNSLSCFLTPKANEYPVVSDVIATTPLRLGDVLYDDLGYEKYQYFFKNAEWLTTAGKGYEDITEYLSKSAL